MITPEKVLSLVTNRALELILLPTEQCNFRCIYCYEDFSIGKMHAETVLAIKQLLMQRASSLEQLKISWFGGEPLAAKDIVYDISTFIMELCHKFPALNYQSNMTTNAFTLNAVVLEKLVALGVKHYQISLDGTAEKHNHTRRRLDGAGTFESIWRNLVAAKSSDLDFTIMLRIHLTPDNLGF